MRRLMIAGVVGLAAPLAIAAPAAAHPSGDQSQYQWLLDNGVAPLAAKEIVKRAAAGDLPDSMTGEEPISVQTRESSDWIVTTATYPDGSVSVSKMEQPKQWLSAPPLVTPYGVGACVAVGGSGYASYYDCRVTGSNGLWLDVEFIADYTRVSNGNATIHAVRGPYVWSAGGTATVPVLSITKAKGSPSSPAKAQAQTQFTSIGGWVSGTYYLYLHVTGGSAWSTQTF